MRLSGVVKEKIARVIGDFFTTNDIVNVFDDANIPTDRGLFAKWRITLDAFNKMSDQEAGIPHILSVFCHPLHFQEPQFRNNFIEKLNTILAYENLKIKATNKGAEILTDDGSPIEISTRQDTTGNDQRGAKNYNDETEEDDEDDVFNYDGGLSSPYENTDLELLILKKILLEHKHRDDSGFFAKEFSFDGNSLEEICRVINKLMEDKILYLSANTRPERFENEEGIEDKSGFINWKMVEKLDKNYQEMNKENGCVIFDINVIDEVKLKGRIDIAIEEFMNDKIYTPLGLMMDKAEVDKMIERIEQETDKNKKSAIEEMLKPKKISYHYYKQRVIIIDEISKDNQEELIISLNNFRDGQVDVLKTLLALEKENLLRITELRSKPMYDQNGNFIGKWSEKDNPVAKIYTLKTRANKQEPLLLKIVEMPELRIKGLEEKVVLQKPKNKKIQLRKFPSDLRWEEISVQFLNEHEVIIKARNETLQTTYEAMGFQDEKRKLPNKQWQFLRLLALKNGEISWESNQNLPLKQINSIKKQKQLLSETLKAYFQINESEPFHDYKTEKAYRIKLTLKPEPELKDMDEREVYDE